MHYAGGLVSQTEFSEGPQSNREEAIELILHIWQIEACSSSVGALLLGLSEFDDQNKHVMLLCAWAKCIAI